ncbi:MAG: hypothetical protein KDB14_08120 [Planctomycetales bacterium]|nr:hypothetical protein [Planctomycetales bacterium]
MNTLLLWLAAIAGPVATTPTSVAPSEAPSDAWVDGSLLLLQDSNSIVSAVTDSRITHVAMLFHPPGASAPLVFEATPARVRQVSLPDYLREIAVLNERRRQPMSVFVMTPRRDFSTDQVESMLTYARHSIGRPYSVKGYVRDRSAEGVHCSEFASRVLCATERYAFHNHHRITPVRLRHLLRFSYRAPVSLQLPAAPKQSWCAETADCWGDFCGWCGWACVESWRFRR